MIDVPSNRRPAGISWQDIEDMSAGGSTCRVPYPLFYGFCLLWGKYSRWSEGQLPPVFNRYKCAAYWKGNRRPNEVGVVLKIGAAVANVRRRKRVSLERDTAVSGGRTRRSLRANRQATATMLIAVYILDHPGAFARVKSANLTMRGHSH